MKLAIFIRHLIIYLCRINMGN